MKRINYILGALLALFSLVSSQTPNLVLSTAKINTSPVLSDPDDPAIWVNSSDPEKSLIIGADKGTYPNGGIFVWNMDGSEQQRINISHPNNIDVLYGLKLGTELVDIAVVTMRDFGMIYVYQIDAITRLLTDITSKDSIKVFPEPYGIALYKRSMDGAAFAFISSKSYSDRKKIWQIRLEDDGTGRVKGTVARKFGLQTSVVEGMVVDSQLGYFYSAEEAKGIHKYYADPEKGDEQLALFAVGDSANTQLESMALYQTGPETGYILASNTAVKKIQVFRREGDGGNPHQHSLVAEISRANGKGGDGMDVTHQSLGENFPNGALIWQETSGKRYQLYSWLDFAKNYLESSSNTTSKVGTGFPSGVTGSFSLNQNYPNPFNPVTTISFELKRSDQVRLDIFSMTGARVRSLINSRLDPGLHHVEWDGRDADGASLPSATYVYRMQSGQELTIKKMTLLK